YLTMAYLKFTQRQPQAALPFLEKILELGQKNPKEPYYPEALYWVGQVFLARRRSDEAVQYVKQACELGYQLGCESPLVRVPSSPPARESETAPEEDAAATDPALTDSQ